MALQEDWTKDRKVDMKMQESVQEKCRKSESQNVTDRHSLPDTTPQHFCHFVHTM
jgi:hypothetical protein